MTAHVRRVRAAAAILLVLALAGGVAGAQAIDTDEEALFGSPDEDTSDLFDSDLFDSDLLDGEVLVTEPEAAPDAAAEPAAPPPVEIGGSYRFSLTGEAHWASPADLADEPLQPDSHRATVDLGATVFLDARPADDFRVFGKVDLSYPFSTDAAAQPAREFDDVVSVKELFSDFSIGDALFLRGGKHTIAWGVGYFFSPADVLNLTAIDPEDPDAEREGPVSLRANLPIDFHNLYLYAIADPVDGGVQLAAAPKAEVVLDGAEVGVGAYFHPERVPRAMLTLTTSLLELDLFAELEGSLGSDRRFVERADRGTGNCVRAAHRAQHRRPVRGGHRRVALHPRAGRGGLVGHPGGPVPVERRGLRRPGSAARQPRRGGRAAGGGRPERRRPGVPGPALRGSVPQRGARPRRRLVGRRAVAVQPERRLRAGRAVGDVPAARLPEPARRRHRHLRRGRRRDDPVRRPRRRLPHRHPRFRPLLTGCHESRRRRPDGARCGTIQASGIESPTPRSRTLPWQEDET